MKYLIILAVIALVFALVYRKMRPYILAVRKFMNIASSVVSDAGAPRQTAAGENKLIRCIACGTWVPATRAIAAGAGGATYCSTECLEKPRSASRKISGLA